MPILLLADDSVTTQRVVALTFADEAVRVVTVADGRQAIEQMAGMRPDIVLASTALPGTNGYQLSQYMLGVDALKEVPVLLLSGAFESVDPAQLEASGARGIIEKPLEPIAVINRVRELLGLKDAHPAPPSGRLVTSATSTGDKKAAPRASTPLPVPPKAPAWAWDEPHPESGPESNAQSAEAGAPGPGREDDRATLETAFDSLDQYLSGRRSEAQAAHRNPSPPLGQASGAPDPRSPGRRPTVTSEGGTSNAVFEVDNDWFANDNQDRLRASSHDILTDAHEAIPPRAAVSRDAIFKSDDECFADEEQERQSRTAQQRELGAEMGIHDVELPHAGPVANAPAPAQGLDFDFGLDNLVSDPATQEPDCTRAEAAVHQPAHQVRVHFELQATVAPSAPSSVADDFAALLAFETGDAPAPAAALVAPTAAPVVVPAVAPEITEAMLDQIAQRVADRLNSGTFGADLREAMITTVRDTVRSAVSHTSERLVQDEIARVKARVDRDTP